MQEDEALLKEAKTKAGNIKVIPIKGDHSALELWQPICLKGDATSDQALLFLPEEYELLEPTTSGMEIAEVWAPSAQSDAPRAIWTCFQSSKLFVIACLSFGA